MEFYKTGKGERLRGALLSHHIIAGSFAVTTTTRDVDVVMIIQGSSEEDRIRCVFEKLEP
jgi:hypothetical protein